MANTMSIFGENRYFTSLVKQNYYSPTWGANTK